MKNLFSEELKMIKNLFFILGILHLTFALFNPFIEYLFFDIPFSLLIVFWLFLTLFFLWIKKVKIIIDKKFVFYFLILFVSMVFVTAINTSYDIISNYITYYLRVLHIFVILISMYLVVNNVDFSKFIRVNSLIYFIGSLVYIIIFWKEHLLVRPEGVLGISDHVAFLAIILFNLEETKKSRYIALIFSFLLLLFYSSFTSITFFIFTILVNIIYSIYLKRNIILKIFTTFFLMCLIVCALVFYIQISKKPIQLQGNSVIVNTINNYLVRIHYVINLEDASLNARLIQFQEGFKILREKPILGEFMYEYRVFGTTGSYMHNMLSYWAEYGLINFLLIFVPYFFYLFRSYKYFVKYDDKVLKALFFSGIYITLIILFSRSYVSMTFWVHYGLLMSSVLKFEREISNQQVTYINEKKNLYQTL